MVKLHKVKIWMRDESDLANFLIELSKEGAKIPIYPTQYKDCLTAFSITASIFIFNSHR